MCPSQFYDTRDLKRIVLVFQEPSQLLPQIKNNNKYEYEPVHLVMSDVDKWPIYYNL